MLPRFTLLSEIYLEISAKTFDDKVFPEVFPERRIWKSYRVSRFFFFLVFRWSGETREIFGTVFVLLISRENGDYELEIAKLFSQLDEIEIIVFEKEHLNILS